MKIGVVIPIWGRRELFIHTLARLNNQTLPPCKVVAVASDEQDKEIAESCDVDVVMHNNFPLGAKWQSGLDYMKQNNIDIDSFLYIGSSDWLSDNWCEVMSEYIKKGAGMVGTLGCHFLDVGKGNNKRLIYWGGYVGDRRNGEPIGIGRMISREMLELSSWNLFPRTMDSSLDFHQLQVVLKLGGVVKNIVSEEIASLSISTYRWSNKHIFDNEALHVNAKYIRNVDEFLNKFNFSEALNLFGE